MSEALADAGDLETVTELLGRLWAAGDGATPQRGWLADGDGDLRHVVERAVAVTHA